LCKMLAAPINPSNINRIEYVYPVRPTTCGWKLWGSWRGGILLLVLWFQKLACKVFDKSRTKETRVFGVHNRAKDAEEALSFPYRALANDLREANSSLRADLAQRSLLSRWNTSTKTREQQQ
jgi:hypothetical protein